MDPRNLSFMTAVLGESGAQALAKATERAADLTHVLVPRTILAWLQAASVYEGELPGVAGSYMAFRKGEAGFTGNIHVGGAAGVHEFTNATLFHVAGAVAVAIGHEQAAIPATVRDLDLARLGKSIDLLAKARRAGTELAKKDRPTGATRRACVKKGAGCPLEFEHKGECKMEKSGTGIPAAPTAPKPPTPPMAPNATPPAAAKPPAPPKPPASPTMKLTRAEAQRECQACNFPQFHRDSFRGCLCFSAFAKSVQVVSSDPEVIVLRFDPEDWGPEELEMFRESIGRDV